MKAIWRSGASLTLAWLICNLSGCAATMAMHQPDAKDLSVLQPGTPRGRVVAELGPPLTSYPSDAGGVDVFNFTQGYTRINRTARAMGHAAGTVMTAGVWEIAGIPIEVWYSGTDVKLEVAYDMYGQVAGVQVFDGAEAFRGRILAEHVHLAGGPPPIAGYGPTEAYGTDTTYASPEAIATPPPASGAGPPPMFAGQPPPHAAPPMGNVPTFDPQPPIQQP
jgi:hypothetical protein